MKTYQTRTLFNKKKKLFCQKHFTKRGNAVLGTCNERGEIYTTADNNTREAFCG